MGIARTSLISQTHAVILSDSFPAGCLLVLWAGRVRLGETFRLLWFHWDDKGMCCSSPRDARIGWKT